MIENRANYIAKKLELDEATSQKFLAIYKSEMEEMRALRPKRGEADGASTTSEETKAKMTALKEKYNKYNPQNEMFSHLGTKRYNFKNETQLFKVIPHTSKFQKNRPASPERNTFEGS